MITCQHAKHLFDRYLDGELPPSLQTELHAHQLSCSDCQSELTLLESCGDVIAYDKSEPTVSASFTDRVLLAHRAQVKPAVAGRNWGRMILSIASPVAAAACIGMAVLLIAPGTPANKGITAGLAVQASDQNIDIIGGTDKKLRTELKAARLDQMQAGFVDVILDPVVKQTRNSLDGAKRSLEQLETLVGLGFSGANNTLAAGWRNLESDRQKSSMTVTPKVSGPDMFAPSLPYEVPTSSDPFSSELDDTIEAL